MAQLSVAEAAQKTNIDKYVLYSACIEGRLQARKQTIINNVQAWVIREEDLQAYLAKYKAKPRKKKEMQEVAV